ncbi:LPXTG-motif cell wall-anchored protein [Actinoplanes octamycinicus]|uniref:LPXTG-motif cell wall-anchored protein n=1 Tax=Actinoplanes octamycinicus TaxID=135948 RepID=A0A7W7M9V0_9ACTN|nr:LPXTG cell wall anchor domain-containing protein [Actinoplanes octamycinicus]MBB4742246.1 LPXTG-motif cell wall-anchored protein [Actinoplanes octamycinicus]GIE59909.1 hypothetical protein Aoc01nite_53110 [Actinoplanes octamycinicus]
MRTRWKMSAGVLIAAALVMPAAPAVARTEPAGLDAECQTVERKVYTDIRQLVTIDLDTATDTEVRVLANQILFRAKAESLPVLPDTVQERLRGTAEDLRAFLQTGLQNAWWTSLRIAVLRTLRDTGANVQATAQKVLDTEALDAYLAYLNDGLYAARALDCAAKPTSTASATASATTTVSASPTSSTSPVAAAGGEDDEQLPVTGAATGAVAGIGGTLLLLGGAGYLLGRRRRSRFVA